MQLIEQVAAQARLTRAQSNGVVNALLQAVVEALTQEYTVSLPDLGTFSVKATAARTGRNPSTGEAIQIPAEKKVAFKVAATLKTRL
ncbi:HU family DNA-binding protein [Deinococcus aquatilis]|uniref:HU family DNA-binding protein n=1 Tax=Deinococcus aquatilis TaxID=519440 RepID=UPI00036675D0|nr:HU family DNA-binding protein [Deinococcus aquatilis]